MYFRHTTPWTSTKLAASNSHESKLYESVWKIVDIGCHVSTTMVLGVFEMPRQRHEGNQELWTMGRQATHHRLSFQRANDNYSCALKASVCVGSPAHHTSLDTAFQLFSDRRYNATFCNEKMLIFIRTYTPASFMVCLVNTREKSKHSGLAQLTPFFYL